MLDTVIQIGKTFREAGKLEHHRFIKRAPLTDKRISVRYIAIPVNKNLSLNVSQKHEITNESLIKHKLFYLTFKTSGSDGMVKYVFGDICYGFDKDGNEVAPGFYAMGDKNNKQKAFHLSSFFRGENDSEIFKGTLIESFRDSFKDKIDKIEGILKDQEPKNFIFLHFDFDKGKHWYQFNKELDLINKKLLDELVAETEQGVVLRKSVYKTIASAEKDLQFPNFNSSALHKVKRFSGTDEVLDLLYAVDFSKKAVISEKDVKVIVLPSGKKLTAEEIEDFFIKKTLLNDAEQAEKAVHWELIKENPFRKVKKPKPPEVMPLFFSEDEFNTMLSSVQSKDFRELCITALLSGLRLAELLNLRWNDLDFTSKIIQVKNSETFTTKSRKNRIVPMSEELFRLMKDRKENMRNESAFVFHNKKGKPLKEQTISQQFKKYVISAGINDKLHFHSLRHSFATHLVKKGVPLFAIQKLLGHSTSKTTEIYSHLLPQQLHREVNILAGLFNLKNSTTN